MNRLVRLVGFLSRHLSVCEDDYQSRGDPYVSRPALYLALGPCLTTPSLGLAYKPWLPTTETNKHP